MRVAYVKSLDLPNRKAHAIQMLKNAQAWAGRSEDFELIVNVRPESFKRWDPQEIAREYGLSRSVRIVPIPLKAEHPSQWERRRDLFFRLAAARCRLRGVDLVHTRSYFFPRYARAVGIPVVAETHGPYKPSAEPLYQEARRPNLLGVVAVTQPVRESLVAHGVPAEKVLVLPNGVDLERFADPLTPTEAKQRLGLPRDASVAVYSGHLYAHRGVEEILAAARLAPDVLFVFAGGMEEDIERWRRRSRDLGNVRWVGFVSNRDVPLHLWAADVLLMPYSAACPTAGWMCPLKTFDYLAAGRAIVASDLPTIRAYLEHDRNALLVAPDDGEALALAVKELLADEPRRSRLADAAREDAGLYSWDRRVEQIAEFVLEAGGARPSRRPSQILRGLTRAAGPLF